LLVIDLEDGLVFAEDDVFVVGCVDSLVALLFELFVDETHSDNTE